MRSEGISEPPIRLESGEGCDLRQDLGAVLQPSSSKRVFVTGGTGYLGTRLIPLLLARGHLVTALVRSPSVSKLPAGCRAVIGDPLDTRSWIEDLRKSDTVVQLVGTPRPAPWKGAQFRAVDLVSGRATIEAAASAGVGHVVYVSVAHPAPIMKAYLDVRVECEALIRGRGLKATILRPWYILGPGHWWPLVLWPGYWLCERFPRTSEAAGRLGLVTLRQMVGALCWAIEHPSEGIRVLEVPDIRARG